MTNLKRYNIQINNLSLMCRKAAAIILSCSILFPAFSFTSHAANDTDIIKLSIFEATHLLENAIETSMSESEAAVKELIVAKDYDYYTTMETFFRCDNPYANVDYLELIAAYMVAMEHTDTLTSSSFYKLPFIQTEVYTTFSLEYIPVTVDNYLKNDDGTYSKSGKIYITEPQTIATFKKNDDGNYIPSGTLDIKLTTKTTKYGDVKLKGLEASDILLYYRLDAEKYMNDVHKKKTRFETIVNGNGLKQSMFLETKKTGLLDTQTINYIESLLQNEDIDINRKYLIDSAVSLVGMVPYEWGGKASKAGYDTTWWTIDQTGRQKGLDCSGFIQWSFMTAGFDKALYTKLISTDTILANTETIDASQLKAGDLGLINNGQRINHVGIYLGNGLWIHCSSAKNTVIVEKTRMFKIYKRMPEGDGSGYTGIPILADNIYKKITNEEIQDQSAQEEQENPEETEPFWENITVYQTDCPFTDAEIYLTAQLMYNEAVGEGLNGWAAVAEVVLNRVNFSKFPNTIEDVIFDPGQFSHSELIRSREPTDEMIVVAREVLSGNMKVLNSGDILFFRNAGGSTKDWGSHQYYETINSHQFYRY